MSPSRATPCAHRWRQPAHALGAAARTTASTRARRACRAPAPRPRPTCSTTPAPSWPSTAGQRVAARAVDRVEVGVADAAGVQAHEHLARPGRRELELGRPRAALRPARGRRRGPSALASGRAFAGRPLDVGRVLARRRRLGRRSPRPAGGLLLGRVLLQLAQLLDGVVAAPEVAGLDLLELRLLLVADVADVARAAGVEDAARRRVGVAGDLALEPDPLALLAVDLRDRGQQRLRVGMVRRR